jgi:hypothetical protein
MTARLATAGRMACEESVKPAPADAVIPRNARISPYAWTSELSAKTYVKEKMYQPFEVR